MSFFFFNADYALDYCITQIFIIFIRADIILIFTIIYITRSLRLTLLQVIL